MVSSLKRVSTWTSELKLCREPAFIAELLKRNTTLMENS
jgi:hypothetical protein